LIGVWIIAEIIAIFFFVRKALEKYQKVKYIDEYDLNNDTYCVTTLEIIWLIGIVLVVSLVGRAIMLIDIFSLGNFRKLHNLDPTAKAVSACNGLFPVICPKTTFAHVSDRIYGFLSLLSNYFYNLIFMV
jgi:hypothetical protein